jgi:hypothetical protein
LDQHQVTSDSIIILPVLPVDFILTSAFSFIFGFSIFAAKMCEDGADLETLMHEQAEMLAEIERHDLWSLDRRIDTTLRALRCPPNDASVAVLSGVRSLLVLSVCFRTKT